MRLLTLSGVQIVAAQPLKAGQEVFNCYGELGNHELLCKYGFALRHNPFNMCTLSKPALLDAAAECLPKAQLAQRRDFLETHRCVMHCDKELPCISGAEIGCVFCSDLLEAEQEPLEVYPGARLSSCLLVLLYVLFSPVKRFKRWQHLEGELDVAERSCAAAISTTTRCACRCAGAAACRLGRARDRCASSDTAGVR